MFLRKGDTFILRLSASSVDVLFLICPHKSVIKMPFKINLISFSRYVVQHSESGSSLMFDILNTSA